MPLVKATCTNCGASLKVDSNKEAAVCPHCDTPYIVEKAIQKYNITNNYSSSVVNVFGNSTTDFLIRAGELQQYLGAATDVIIPDGVTSIGDEAFSGCTGLTSVTIPNSVTSIADCAFCRCTGLTTVSIPDSVTKVGDCAFLCCINLKTINASDEWKTKHWKIHPLLNKYKPQPKSSASNSDYRCYIATAVYGSYDCPQVWTLRRFRDDVLSKSWFGRAFICIYYAVSPTLVKWFGDKTWFKKAIKPRLDNLVYRLQKKGIPDTPYDDRPW